MIQTYRPLRFAFALTFLALVPGLAGCPSTPTIPEPSDWQVSVKTDSIARPERKPEILPLEPRLAAGLPLDPALLDRVRETYHDETVREAHYRVLGPRMRGMLLEQAGYQGTLDLVGHEAADLAQKLGTDQYLTLEIAARDDAGLSLTATRSQAGLWEKPIVRIHAMAPPEIGALTQAVRTLVREAMDPDRLPVDEPEQPATPDDPTPVTRPAEPAVPEAQATPDAEEPEIPAPTPPTEPQPTEPEKTTKSETQATTSPESSSDQATSKPPSTAENIPTQLDATTPADGEVVEVPQGDPLAIISEGPAGSLTRVLSLDLGVGVGALAFSTGAADQLAAGTLDGRILVLDPADGRTLRELRTPESIAAGAPVVELGYGADYKLLFAGTGGPQAAIMFWDAAGENSLGDISSFAGTENAAALSPDGHWLAGAAADASVFVFDLVKGGWRHQALAGHQGSVYGVAWTKDGSAIYTGGADRSLRAWNAETGAQTWSVEHVTAVDAIAVMAPTLLAVGLGGGQVVLHESASGRTLASWDAHKHSVSRVIAVPGGRTLATAGYDGRVALWNLAEAQNSNTIGKTPAPLVLVEEGPPVRALAVSADGKRLALATETGRLDVWRMD